MRKVKKKNIFDKLKKDNHNKNSNNNKKKKLENKKKKKNETSVNNQNNRNHRNNRNSNYNKNNKNNNVKYNSNKNKELSKTIKNKKHKNIKDKSNKKEKKKKRSFWKKLLTVILILGISAVLLVTAFFGYIVLSAPKFEESAFNVNDQTVIYDLKGEIIATLGTEKRESVTYDELPQVLIDAIIATEDSRYFQHNGVDLPRFIKASIYQLLGKDEAGGASTITMQVVKNNLTSTISSGIKGIIRKFQDVYLAVFKVEKEYSKEEIIELYVNNYNLGANVYGVGEASKYYFGKSVSELTLPEASLIAGLFQAPNGHNPYKNLDSATSRRNTVLKLMVRHGYITQEEADIANKISIDSLIVGVEDNTEYQGYVDTVVKEVSDLTGDNPYEIPMKIYTTMEKSIQDGINKILNGEGYTWKNDTVQAGIAIVNVETGAVAAVGAGRNKTGVNQLNYATQVYKQPGSTAKPIFAYGPGIEYKNYSSYTPFYDEPWAYTNGPSVNNWDGTYYNLVTMRKALQVSRNIPALKAIQQVGMKNVNSFAQGLGLDVSLNSSDPNYKVYSNGNDNTVNEAYSIGGVAKGFTPLEMASAYSAFASGGYYTEPYTVTKIEYRETGEVIENKPTKERVMKDSTAYIMNNILESAVNSGFNGGARVYGSHVAAKTGTSNYDDATMKKYKLPGHAVNDLWTVAYTSKYSIAVWYGYKDVTVGYNTSGTPKDNLTSAVMKYIPKDTKGWSMPSSVVAVKVEKDSVPAKLPSEYTPKDMITTEYFVRGTQPTEVSVRYSQLNNVTNLQTSKHENSVTLTWDFETPYALSDEYLDKYFDQSTFGNSSEKAKQERIKYNEKTLGNVGFAIYQEENDGTLTLLSFTEKQSYTYTGYGNVKLIVKAEHKNYKTNASTGTSVTIDLGTVDDNSKIIASLNGKKLTSTTVGSYKEAGIKSIYYNDIDVTTTATIKYQVPVGTTIKDFNSIQELETGMNSLEPGTYKITYIISYMNKEETLSRTVTLKKAS